MADKEQELNQIFDVDGNPISEDTIKELTDGKGDDKENGE